jgi:excisionase family DNA binding protein
MTNRLLSPKDVATYLGIPVQTMYAWRTKGGGPRGFRVGRHVRYRAEDVNAWLESRADRHA